MRLLRKGGSLLPRGAAAQVQRLRRPCMAFPESAFSESSASVLGPRAPSPDTCRTRCKSKGPGWTFSELPEFRLACHDCGRGGHRQCAVSWQALQSCIPLAHLTKASCLASNCFQLYLSHCSRGVLGMHFDFFRCGPNHAVGRGVLQPASTKPLRGVAAPVITHVKREEL